MEDFWHKYEIDQTASLDQKNFGSVYIGVEKENNKKWAVKITEVHPAFDKKIQEERFVNTQQLDHPNLLSYKEFQRFDNNDIIDVVVMPLVERGSLNNYWDLSIEDKKLIVDQVLDGLYYLHEHQFVWQNLSAQHILLDEDFGNYIPKFINYGNKQQIPLAFFANYEYLAPEQFEDNAKVNEQTDIWAYGVLLYQIWTGRLPFGEKSASLPNSKIQERIMGNWELGLMHQIPQPYQQIAQKCLQKEPQNRWTNCLEIIDIIKSHLDEATFWQNPILTNTITEEQNSTTTRRVLRKPNKPIVWWQVVLLFLIAGILGYLVGHL